MSFHRGVARDTAGNSLNEASVSVFAPGTTTEATIYSEETLTTVQSNPISTGVDGVYEFYVLPGYYDIQVAKSGFTTTTLTNVIIGNIFGQAQVTTPSSDTVGTGFIVLDNTFGSLAFTSLYNSGFELTAADRLKYIGGPDAYVLFTAVASVSADTADGALTFEIKRTGDATGFATANQQTINGDFSTVVASGMLLVEENDEFYVQVKYLFGSKTLTCQELSISAMALV